uniref:Uncharacterized protein n=2 Tax=Oryctolagus cuniculus TaxID=9986 RepID=G1TFT0_RABIT
HRTTHCCVLLILKNIPTSFSQRKCHDDSLNVVLSPNLLSPGLYKQIRLAGFHLGRLFFVQSHETFFHSWEGLSDHWGINRAILGAVLQSDFLDSCHLQGRAKHSSLNMKVVMVLLLAALPLYCYAGSGCVLLESVVEKTIDPSVSVEEYKADLQRFIDTEQTEAAVEEFKECFLSQSNETLANFRVMVHTVYDSLYCAAY